jgi:polyphosphate kinase
MTCNPLIGEDATAVFNMLSGYSEPLNWNMLAVAPLWLRNKFLKLIERETKNAEAGKPASIIAKMNSLCDKDIIAALYKASCAGVKIRLVVRGICSLRAGIPGLSENIEVRSIVGEFLEHARVFIFENGGSEEIYMGSADWMPRNLDRRVEILFPVLKDELKDRIRKYMEVQLEDNLKAHVQQPDGTYEKPDRRGKLPVGAQMTFCEMAIAAAKEERKKHEEEQSSRVFIPIESHE